MVDDAMRFDARDVDSGTLQSQYSKRSVGGLDIQIDR